MIDLIGPRQSIHISTKALSTSRFLGLPLVAGADWLELVMFLQSAMSYESMRWKLPKNCMVDCLISANELMRASGEMACSGFSQYMSEIGSMHWKITMETLRFQIAFMNSIAK